MQQLIVTCLPSKFRIIIVIIIVVVIIIYFAHGNIHFGNTENMIKTFSRRWNEKANNLALIFTHMKR